MTDSNRPDLAVFRVRHALKFRLLQVRRVRRITSSLICITLGGEDLHDFESTSFDDHVKVFFPPPGAEKPALPRMGPDGPVFPEGETRPVARDFTPRRYDRAARTLDIEFALHQAGPAATWTAQASEGQYLGIGGPRGSLVIPQDFDWHLMIGDETALPAIARRLEEFAPRTRVETLVEVRDPSARITFATKADLREEWRYRGESSSAAGSALVAALRLMPLPPGEGYVWAAGEAAAIRAVRQYLCAERGIDKSRIRAASYWKRGTQAVHELIED